MRIITEVWSSWQVYLQGTAEQESDSEAPATGEAKGEGRRVQPRLSTGPLSLGVLQGASHAQLRKMQQVC